LTIFTPTNPAKIVAQQRYEAERLRLEHEAAAEHHAALAVMYAARISRLNAIQQKESQ
jgi:hypothetical protein